MKQPAGFAEWLRSVPAKTRDPVVHGDVFQAVKAAGAAMAAWSLAIHVLHLQQPFLAPWAALLTVHATVYRTLSRGIQQVGATVLGVLLAFVVGTGLGVNAETLGFALLLGLVLGRSALLRDERVTVATTALIVLATGYSQDAHVLLERLLDTGVGIGAGFLVNLVILPPLADRSAARQVDQIDDVLGQLLSDMHDGITVGAGPDMFDAWVERTRALDHDIDYAWAVVSEANESIRFNLRRRARADGRRRASQAHVLHRLEQAVAETRSMARTLANTAESLHDWDPWFKTTWLTTLAQVGKAVTDADPDAVAAVDNRMDQLVSEMSTSGLPGMLWPTYGALVVNLRNIVEALVDVAAAQPMSLG